jgi:membrane-associated phospholipid phosphatase
MVTRLVVLLALLAAAPARAEEQPAAWPSHRALADSLSTAFTTMQLTADVVHAWRQPDRWAAVRCSALRIGVALGAAELTKRVVDRTRPDGSDQRSFFSQHTALATAASGWSISAGIPIAFGAGYGRAAANKHYWSDIAVGAAVGLLARRVCRGAEGS